MLKQTLEIWKAIPGYEGAYEVSDRGRVRSLDRYVDVRTLNPLRRNRRLLWGRVLSPWPDNTRHLLVRLGGRRSLHVHILVIIAFRGPRPPKMQARHLNGREGDNRATNLEWSTKRRNHQDIKHHKGQRNYKLRPWQIRRIKQALAKPYFGVGRDLAKRFKVSQTTIGRINNSRIRQDIVL